MTTSIQEELQAFKKLSDKDRSSIMMAISKLETMRISGHPPSSEEMLSELEKTNHLEIAMACYGAQLQGHTWY